MTSEYSNVKRNQRSLMARKGRRLNGTMKIND